MSEQDVNDHLKNALKSLNETEEISLTINSELSAQRKQLERTQDKLHKINYNLQKCESTTKNMTSYWRSFVNWFTPSNNQPSKGTEKIVNNPQERSTPLKGLSQSPIQSQPSRGNHGANTDENVLIHINQKLANLKDNAVLFGHELDHQNSIIDDMNDKATDNKDRIQNINEKIKRLM